MAAADEQRRERKRDRGLTLIARRFVLPARLVARDHEVGVADGHKVVGVARGCYGAVQLPRSTVHPRCAGVPHLRLLRTHCNMRSGMSEADCQRRYKRHKGQAYLSGNEESVSLTCARLDLLREEAEGTAVLAAREDLEAGQGGCGHGGRAHEVDLATQEQRLRVAGVGNGGRRRRRDLLAHCRRHAALGYLSLEKKRH